MLPACSKHSVAGLQQSLRTRSELKNELRLALTTVQSAGNNPLKHSADASEALNALLRGGKPGQLSAEQAVGRAFRDLQAHQVALLAASRAAVHAMFEQLAPEQLALRFEREGRKPCSPPPAVAGVPIAACITASARMPTGANACSPATSRRPMRSRCA